MLLLQLMSALAKRRLRKDVPTLPPPEPAIGGTVASPTQGPPRGPDNTDPPVAAESLAGGPIASATPGPPKHEAIQSLYGSDEEALAAFVAMSKDQQLAALDRELLKLKDHEKIVVLDTLKKELGQKWMALPGPQTDALRSPADIILYGGQAGGGKSDLLLGLALTEHKRSLIMRRQYTDLSFLTERGIEINGTRSGFNGSPPPTLRTDDGRVIEFGAASRPGDEESFQGRPHSLLAVDEAAQFLESQIRYLMGWVRSTDPDERTRVVLATNPPLSDEGQWLVSMFRAWLDPQHPRPAKAGELRWFVTDIHGEDLEVDGPGPHTVEGSPKPVRALSRTFIPARLGDNAFLARTEYGAKLDALPEPLRSAVRDGNFMAVRQDDAFQVIPSEWIRLAQGRWTPEPPLGPHGQAATMSCISVDSAGGGSDEAPIVHRYGTWFGTVDGEKGPQTANGRFMGAQVLMRRRNNCQVVVDIGGGYGSEIVTTLEDNQAPVHGFKGAEASTGKSIGSKLDFANMRAEVWYRFREALDPENGENIALPPDMQLAADLATPRLDARALQVRGVLQVESKEDIRKRLGRSPDRGDATVTCWAYGGLIEYQRKQSPRLPPRANVGHAGAKRYAGR